MSSSALVSGGSAIGAPGASITQQALGSSLVRVGTVSLPVGASTVYLPDVAASTQAFAALAQVPNNAGAFITIPYAAIQPTVVAGTGLTFNNTTAVAVQITYIVVG